LKYWRDSAARGHRPDLGDNEAFTSLLLLLRGVSLHRSYEWVFPAGELHNVRRRKLAGTDG
jgi:hypothetical protein